MGTILLERKTGRCLKDRVINKPNTVRDGVAPAGVFFSCSSCMYRRSVAVFFFLIVFSPLEASEKNVVWVLIFYFLYYHFTPGNIGTFFVNIVFPS